MLLFSSLFLKWGMLLVLQDHFVTAALKKISSLFIHAVGSDCPVNLKIRIVDIQCRGYAAVLGADFDFLMAR